MATKTETSLLVEPNVVHTSIPQSILEDLCSRFLINLPEDEQDDMVRVFFQIEQALWYYTDFYCQEEQTILPSYGLREFTRIIFEKFPFINKKGEKIDKLLSDWKKYKFSVPVYGAVLLNTELDMCVLVQSYQSKSSWGFPRGKLNKDEAPLECAIREVLEETGFDMTLLAKTEDFLDVYIQDRLVRLYFVPNVPVETEFETRTRGEIKDIQWFNVKDLPVSRKDTRIKENVGLSPNNFFMVIPFVKGLKKWIAGKQREHNLLVVQQQSVESQPEHQLRRLVQSEDDHLKMENKKLQDERRRQEAQQRFLSQLDLYHPLRPQGFGNNQRKGPIEHDQKQFKILQRSDAEGTRDRESPQGRRASPLSSRTTTRLSPSITGTQELNPSDSRSLSPSNNSAFTRVSRGTRVSPKMSRKNNAGGREQVVSPSGSRRQQRTKKKNDGEETACSFNFLAPAWNNFTFDRQKILAAIQG